MNNQLYNTLDKFCENFINNISIKELSERLDKTSNKGIGEGPMFIFPNGDVYSGNEMHIDMLAIILETVIIQKYSEITGEKVSDEDMEEIHDIAYENGDYAIDYLSDKYNIIRVNGGRFQEFEDRFYCVLQEKRPSDTQFLALLEIIDRLKSIEFDSLLVFVETDVDTDSYTYDLNSSISDDVIKSIKRYYSSGEFYESLQESEEQPIE